MEEYKKTVRFVNENDSSNGEQLIIDRVVPARLSVLQNLMEQDNKLYTLLNTQIKDLPKNYRFLADELFNDVENETLYHFIALGLTFRGFFTFYFTKSDSIITSIAACRIGYDEVYEIKMLSFNPLQSFCAVRIRDFNILLDNFIKKYKKVSWSAMKKNPSNRIYQKAIKKQGGCMKEQGDDILYYIEKEK